jgi:hypothetical protein
VKARRATIPARLDGAGSFAISRRRTFNRARRAPEEAINAGVLWPPTSEPAIFVLSDAPKGGGVV